MHMQVVKIDLEAKVEQRKKLKEILMREKKEIQ